MKVKEIASLLEGRELSPFEAPLDLFLAASFSLERDFHKLFGRPHLLEYRNDTYGWSIWNCEGDVRATVRATAVALALCKLNEKEACELARVVKIFEKLSKGYLDKGESIRPSLRLICQFHEDDLARFG